MDRRNRKAMKCLSHGMSSLVSLILMVAPLAAAAQSPVDAANAPVETAHSKMPATTAGLTMDMVPSLSVCSCNS